MSTPPDGHEPDTDLDPERLRAHQQAGFSRTYWLDDNSVSAAVEAPQRHAHNTEPAASLKSRVQANLIRLFQLAVLFDDFFPPDAKDEPSDRLMDIIAALWDMDVPQLAPAAMRAVLNHWYGRHLEWWKANRRSKHQVRAGRELVLVNLMDEYRRSRRYGVPRREREAEGGELEASFRSSRGAEVHPRYLASRVVQWMQIMSTCPDVVYARVLPCPPLVVDFLSDKGATFSENLMDDLLDERKGTLEDDEVLTELVAPSLTWITTGKGKPPSGRYLKRDLHGNEYHDSSPNTPNTSSMDDYDGDQEVEENEQDEGLMSINDGEPVSEDDTEPASEDQEQPRNTEQDSEDEVIVDSIETGEAENLQLEEISDEEEFDNDWGSTAAEDEDSEDDEYAPDDGDEDEE